MEKKIYGRVAGIVALVLCVSLMGVPVLANATEPPSYEDGPTSNIWLSVVELPSGTRISVTVPLSYGFAVVGSAASSDNGAVTSSGGKVLLSNIRVEVTDSGDYRIVTEGLPQIPLQNYSTDVKEGSEEEEDPLRFGLSVKAKPYINEVPEAIINGIVRNHYWKPIETDPTGNTTLFKRYRMGIDSKWFDTPGTLVSGTETHSVYYMGSSLELDAPPDVPTNGWTAGGSAHVPSNHYFNVAVQVGGIQNQYYQVEQSVKVGQIGWEITPGVIQVPVGS